MRLLFASCLLVLSSACASNVEVTADANAPTGPSAPVTTDPDRVVGRAAGTELKLGDIDKKVVDRIEKAKNDYDNAIYEARKAAIDGAIDELVTAAEAKKRGITVEALLKAEIDDKAPAPSEAELQGFYEQMKDRMEGAPYEQMRDRIAEYLGGEKKRTRHAELIAELRKAHGASSLLEPLRVAVDTKGPIRGKADARITVVVFADFECGYCAQTAPTVDKLQHAYPDDVRIVFKHFPLDFHAQAMPAAEASVCAGEQGKFWELHDKFFSQQVPLEVAAARTFLASTSGFDASKFDQCIASGKGREVVAEDLAAGAKAGVDGTPAFFVNGVKLGGARPYEDFQALVIDELGRLE